MAARIWGAYLLDACHPPQGLSLPTDHRLKRFEEHLRAACGEAGMMDWWKKRCCFMAWLDMVIPETPVSLRTTTQHHDFTLACIRTQRNLPSWDNNVSCSLKYAGSIEG
jgi:hypothetical protein